jgi:undecaprenyl-diphosphatase
MPEILRLIDVGIFRVFNGTMHSGILDMIAPYITEAGGGVFVFAVAIVMIFAGRRKVTLAGILLLSGLSITYYVVHFIKIIVQRPRPFIALSDVNILYTTGGFSFPSNHSATAFMAAFVLSWCFGKRYFFYFLACVVAVSRMYLGVHYPLDVVAGAVIGMTIGYVLVSVSDNMSKPQVSSP